MLVVSLKLLLTDSTKNIRIITYVLVDAYVYRGNSESGQRVFVKQFVVFSVRTSINPLKPELNPICYLLALLETHHFLHISRIRVQLLTFRLLMSYIYMEHPFLMFLDHTQRRSTVGRTPLDE